LERREGAEGSGAYGRALKRSITRNKPLEERKVHFTSKIDKIVERAQGSLWSKKGDPWSFVKTLAHRGRKLRELLKGRRKGNHGRKTHNKREIHYGGESPECGSKEGLPPLTKRRRAYLPTERRAQKKPGTKADENLHKGRSRWGDFRTRGKQVTALSELRAQGAKHHQI